MRRGRDSTQTSRPRDRDADMDLSKERSHSSSSSGSSRRNKSSPRDVFPSSGSGNKSRHSSDRERSSERESSAKKSRLKPPPLVVSSSDRKAASGIDAVSPTGIKGNPDFPMEEDLPDGLCLCTMDKFELYSSVNKSDEEEARNMDSEESMQVLFENYSELQEMIIAIFEARKNAKNQAEMVELVASEGVIDIERRSAILVACIRRSNRLLKLRLKHEKEEIQERRTNVDKNHLELQNLLYEALHLKKQVVAVKDYKSMDEQIDLVPLDQFYKEAPEKISKAHVTQNDSHLLRIARLEYEFIQRQQLSQQCNELDKQKDVMSDDIESYKKRMEAVKPILTNILGALEPAQEFYNPGFRAKRDMYKTAEYLPSPLYVLFVSSVGYQEYLDKSFFKISITGDMDAAKEIINSPVVPIAMDSDSEMEVEEPVEAEASDRRKLRKHMSIADERQDHARKIVESHPLKLEWTIAGENAETLKMRFHYLTKLRIITVETELEMGDVTDKVKELVTERSNRILEDIYTDDDGEESPNPSTSFYLKIAGVESLSEFIPKIGRPYKWAQELAGFHFPSNDPQREDEISAKFPKDEEYDFLPTVDLDTKPDKNLSTKRMDGTFKRIVRRLNCQSQLWMQLRNLETRTLQIPSELQKFFPSKNSTIFMSWEAIDWKTYKSFPSTVYPITVELVQSSAMFFKAILERGRARIIAAIALTLNYPDDPPIFSVHLDDSGIGKNRVSSSVFREVERELNVYCVKEFVTSSASILSLQLQRLLYCVDISLETMADDDSAGPSEFAREKLFECRVKGKGFRRPFKYVPKFGGHFTQRF